MLSSYNKRDYNILIVDDIESNVRLIKRILAPDKKLIFFPALSGKEGLEIIKQNKIDLVLLDIMMPDISGLEVLEILKDNPDTENIPVILVTAKTQSEDIVRGLDTGAEDYITKPFHSSELRARVASVLRSKFLYDSLVEQNSKLSELNELKDGFLSMASHDIRNNLTGIIGHCYIILMEKYGKLNGHYKQSLNIILKRSKSISNLVTNIIDAAKIEAGKLVLNFCDVDFENFISQYYNDISVLHNYEDIDFSLNINENISNAYIDSEKIDEVFTNLISNAVKFTPKEGSIEIKISNYDDNYILCSVIDTGPGISDEDKNNLFTKFTQGKTQQQGKKKIKSSGLGLSICKGIVEAHTGKIWVEYRNDGKSGTVFNFTIPAHKTAVKNNTTAENTATVKNIF